VDSLIGLEIMGLKMGIRGFRLMSWQKTKPCSMFFISVTRQSQVKVAAMLALSQGLIKQGDRIVCLAGSPKYEIFDSLTVMDVGREFEIFSSKDLDITSKIDKPHVFDRLLTLILELAEEGKEGKPLGTIFILGDDKKVMEHSSQMVINPFDLQWIRLAPESPIVCRSIGESEIRKRTEASVVGVVREGQLRPNPDAEFVLIPNDLIAIIGSESDRETFCQLTSSTACDETLPRT